LQSQASLVFTTEEIQAQNHLPLKNSKLKTFYPRRIPSSEKLQSQASLVFTPEEFQTQNTLTLKNSKKNSRDLRQGADGY
jgi:hypothetical protein